MARDDYNQQNFRGDREDWDRQRENERWQSQGNIGQGGSGGSGFGQGRGGYGGSYGYGGQYGGQQQGEYNYNQMSHNLGQGYGGQGLGGQGSYGQPQYGQPFGGYGQQGYGQQGYGQQHFGGHQGGFPYQGGFQAYGGGAAGQGTWQGSSGSPIGGSQYGYQGTSGSMTGRDMSSGYTSFGGGYGSQGYASQPYSGYGQQAYGAQNYDTQTRGYRTEGERFLGQGRGPESRFGGTERWNQSQSFSGRGPKGYQRSDERIREDVSEELTRHPDIDASDIDVKVEKGEVTLTGTVEDRHAKRLAEDLAERCPGVRDVNNQLKVHGSFWDKVTGKDQEHGREQGRTEQEPGRRRTTGSTT
jgi:osmotically-inducible protein OsmY